MAENLPDTNVGNIEYIRKADAVEAAKHAWAKGLEPSQYIESLEPADVVPVTKLQEKITDLKYKMDCHTPNIDYYTGYMSALSTVEGILAKMDGEE